MHKCKRLNDLQARGHHITIDVLCLAEPRIVTTVETLRPRAELVTSAKTTKRESGAMSLHPHLPVGAILLAVPLCGVQRDRETQYEAIDRSTPHKSGRHIKHTVPLMMDSPNSQTLYARVAILGRDGDT